MISYNIQRFTPEPPIPPSHPARPAAPTGVKVYVVERADKSNYYFRWLHPATGKWLSRKSSIPKERPRGDTVEERQELEKNLRELYAELANRMP